MGFVFCFCLQVYTGYQYYGNVNMLRGQALHEEEVVKQC